MADALLWLTQVHLFCPCRLSMHIATVFIDAVSRDLCVVLACLCVFGLAACLIAYVMQLVLR